MKDPPIFKGYFRLCIWSGKESGFPLPIDIGVLIPLVHWAGNKAGEAKK
jgi:hypothetical protein